jgi:hypothetical protein
MPGETLPAGSTNTQGLADWAAPYITNYLGKAQALSETPYQAYQGPLTAGTSDLQNKAFQGIANLAFPTNLGQSFSSTGAYQPPPMNMRAYQQQPIGVGTPRPTYQQYTSSLGPDQTAVPQNIYDAGLAGNQVYNSVAPVSKDSTGMPLVGDLGAGGQGQMPKFATMQDMIRDGNFTRGPSNGGVYDATEGGGVSGLAGISQPNPMGGVQPQSPGIASQYMNPYLQSVLTPQLEELRRQNDITTNAGNAKMAQSGAFGGGRQAILNAENNRNLMQEMNKTVGQGYSSAYDKGMQQFNTEQGQAKDLVNLIGNAGAQQRGITAEGIAADKAEFEAQRQFPFQQAQFQRDMISGLPTGSVTNTPANLTGMGAFLSALGGGTAAASALGYKNVGDLLDALGLNLGQKQP